MTNQSQNPLNLSYLRHAVHAALDAGKAILKIYDRPVKVQYKADQSPLTEADQAAHTIIVNHLQKATPEIPILSEEGRDIPYEERRQWKRFWLVDPLDGTKEFIKRNGEFTVNIALIEKEKPVMGVIFVPCLDQLYFGTRSLGSFKLENCKSLDWNLSIETLVEMGHKLPCTSPPKSDSIRVVGSRSHGSEEFRQYVEFLKSEYETVKITPAGSSLKFCLVAEGKADIYPRLAPTMEWDTAAGHIIAELSESSTFSFGSQEPLKYNKDNLLNPSFCCFRSRVNPIHK